MAQVAEGGAWRPLPDDDFKAEEELRLAVVLNGGVSLAIWMGGVVLEIHRLTKREGVYGRVLLALNSRARADVIAGTSAGGINGGALALGQVYPDSDVGALRDVWAREGSLYDLLQEPWSGKPDSLLQGNAKFLPALEAAFTELTRPARAGNAQGYSPDDRPIALTLTTTLLTPMTKTLTDVLGEQVFQPSHAGRFQFWRIPEPLPVPDGSDKRDHFAPSEGGLPRRLALAARSTASFPVAFEPVHVPIGVGTPDGVPPDMGGHANFDVSRWVVDGGALMNTPVEPVLEQITAAPASKRVRRALLLVVPDPYVPGQAEREAESDGAIPTIPLALRNIVKAMTTQTVAEDLRRIEAHNLRAASRRGSRTDLLRTLKSGEQMRGIAESLHDVYLDLRVARAADQVAKLTASTVELPVAMWSVRLREHWLAAVHRPQDAQPQPYPPIVPGSAGYWGPLDADGRWQWGVATLERLSVAVQDLLKRAIWLLPGGGGWTAGQGIEELRTEYAVLAGEVRLLRRADSRFWQAWSPQESAGVAVGPSAALSPDELLGAVDKHLATWWRSVSDGIESAGEGPSGTPVADRLQSLAESLVWIGHRAARICWPFLPAEDDHLLQSDRLKWLCTAFLDDPEIWAGGRHDPMSAALALEVCYLCLVEGDNGGASEQVVDLVRISAGVRQPFAPTLEASQRVAGLRLGHFAAFLKQTWRVNDWMWGRLDGANRLITLLLDPERLRRRVVLGAPAGAGSAATDAERACARRLLGIILGLPEDQVDEHRWALVLDLLTGDVPLEQGREVLAPLVDHLVEEEAEGIVRAEEPALLRAVRADEEAGETPTSAGSKWRSARYAGTGETLPGESEAVPARTTVRTVLARRQERP